MKGKDSQDPGKFRSFGELVNTANEGGAASSSRFRRCYDGLNFDLYI